MTLEEFDLLCQKIVSNPENGEAAIAIECMALYRKLNDEGAKKVRDRNPEKWVLPNKPIHECLKDNWLL